MLPQTDASLSLVSEVPIKMSKQDKIALELESIRIKNEKKLLVPAEVVEFARDENTELHNHFEWDDVKAAHQYRLWQSRQIIASIESKEYEIETIQVYVSLPKDRMNPNGGYRITTEVLSDSDLLKQLIASAKSDADYFRKKYIMFKELTPALDNLDSEINKIQLTL